MLGTFGVKWAGRINYWHHYALLLLSEGVELLAVMILLEAVNTSKTAAMLQGGIALLQVVRRLSDTMSTKYSSRRSASNFSTHHRDRQDTWSTSGRSSTLMHSRLSINSITTSITGGSQLRRPSSPPVNASKLLGEAAARENENEPEGETPYVAMGDSHDDDIDDARERGLHGHGRGAGAGAGAEMGAGGPAAHHTSPMR